MKNRKITENIKNQNQPKLLLKNINEINKSEPGWSGGKKKREREGWSRYKLPTTRMRISL